MTIPNAKPSTRFKARATEEIELALDGGLADIRQGMESKIGLVQDILKKHDGELPLVDRREAENAVAAAWSSQDKDDREASEAALAKLEKVIMRLRYDSLGENARPGGNPMQVGAATDASFDETDS